MSEPIELIRVVDGSGQPVDRGQVVSLLREHIENHFADIETLHPFVLKMSDRGPAWLYAYVDHEHGLRVEIAMRLLSAVETGTATPGVKSIIEQRVRDLAANLRSRAGSSKHYFRRNTRTLEAFERE